MKIKSKINIQVLIVFMLSVTSFECSISSAFGKDTKRSTYLMHHKSVRFEVSAGDCKDCKKIIEKTIRQLSGIESAVWKINTKILSVIYDPMLIDPNRMKRAIAKRGFDTDTIRATDEAYSLVTGCCKYKRKLAPN